MMSVRFHFIAVDIAKIIALARIYRLSQPLKDMVGKSVNNVKIAS